MKKEIGTAIAIVDKVQTTRDGGYRITIDLPDSEVSLAQNLLKIKAKGNQLVYVVFIEKEQDG